MKFRTNYMGLNLRSPIVVSACPLSEKLDNIADMEKYGAGAVVLFSLFEEQIQREKSLYRDVLETTTNSFPEAQNYFPDIEEYRIGTEKYLELISEAKACVDIPIIGSLNGTSNEGWIEYARQIEQAGADGLEINVFFIPADIGLDGREVENRYISILETVKDTVSIPVAVKLNPYFSAMGNMAKKLEQAGADGLVMFNRFYQPDFDIDHLKVMSNLRFSSTQERRLPLLWIAALYGRIESSLAATTGVQGAEEVIKYLLAGADVVMTASALYKFGIDHLQSILLGIDEWMDSMGFDSVSDFRGIMSQQNVADPTAFERANYLKILSRA
ncbi:MAG: dihydroorotate dehydrogenase-like protein [Saprospiraceae bacterium]|nr:dihydroorotate dehydrogenase-like protein [Saprospiraceae bacterium]